MNPCWAKASGMDFYFYMERCLEYVLHFTVIDDAQTDVYVLCKKLVSNKVRKNHQHTEKVYATLRCS